MATDHHLPNAERERERERESYYIEQLQHHIGSDRQTCRSLLISSQWDVYRATVLYNAGCHIQPKPVHKPKIHSFEDVAQRTTVPTFLAGSKRSPSADFLAGGTIIRNKAEETYTALAAIFQTQTTASSSSSSSPSSSPSPADQRRSLSSSSPDELLFQSPPPPHILPASSTATSSPLTIPATSSSSTPSIPSSSPSLSSSSSLPSSSSCSKLIEGVLVVYKNGIVWGDHLFFPFATHFAQIQTLVEQLRNGRTPSFSRIPSGVRLHLRILKKTKTDYVIRPIKERSAASSSSSSSSSSLSLSSSSPSASLSSSTLSMRSSSGLPSSPSLPCIPCFCSDPTTDHLAEITIGQPASTLETKTRDMSREHADKPTLLFLPIILASGSRIKVAIDHHDTLADLHLKLLPFTCASFSLCRVYPRQLLSDWSQPLFSAALHNHLLRVVHS